MRQAPDTIIDTPPPAHFHADSGAVRFWVSMDDGATIGAIIGLRTLHYRFDAEVNETTALSIYSAHRDEIDAAVKRRVAGGSIEPVMIREHDLPQAARR